MSSNNKDHLYKSIELIDKKLNAIRGLFWICFIISIIGVLFGYFTVFSSVPIIFLHNKGYTNSETLTFIFIWMTVVLFILYINKTKSILSFTLFSIITFIEITISILKLDRFSLDFPTILLVFRMLVFLICLYGITLSLKKENIEEEIYT